MDSSVTPLVSDRGQSDSDRGQSGAEDLVIRAPVGTDAEGLAALFSEMQQHYRRPVPWDCALEAARLACRPPVTTFDPRVLIALQGRRIVGSIVLNVTFPAYELTQSLYIRDLYVLSTARRSGVGRALVSAAAQLTYAQGFSALDWTTDAENVAAQRMYESCGARLLPRVYYRLAREDISD